MVTDLPERGVVPLLRVAVKVTGWPTVGVVVVGGDGSGGGCFTYRCYRAALMRAYHHTTL